jgi:hypothetical protein
MELWSVNPSCVAPSTPPATDSPGSDCRPFQSLCPPIPTWLIVRRRKANTHTMVVHKGKTWKELVAIKSQQLFRVRLTDIVCHMLRKWVYHELNIVISIHDATPVLGEHCLSTGTWSRWSHDPVILVQLGSCEQWSILTQVISFLDNSWASSHPVMQKTPWSSCHWMICLADILSEWGDSR